MTMSVIFCLSYDLSKELFIAFKVDIISTKNALLSRTSSDKIRCLFANYRPLYMVYNQKLTNANIKKQTKDLYIIGEKGIFILESHYGNPCFCICEN